MRVFRGEETKAREGEGEGGMMGMVLCWEDEMEVREERWVGVRMLERVSRRREVLEGKTGLVLTRRSILMLRALPLR